MQVEDRGQRGRWQDRGDEFLRHRVYLAVGKRSVDQNAVPGIGHIGELGDVVLVLTTEPPKFKRDLDPVRCRLRFKAALSSA